MKYKAGDKFIIEITKVIRGTTEYKYAMSHDDRWPERWVNKLQSYEEPKQARWIDGAVQLPKEGDVVKYHYPYGSNNATMFEGTVVNPEAFSETWWMLKSDFPMPEEPKVIIENCPYCDSDCFISMGGIAETGTVICHSDTCAYRATTLEAHNALCRRLK